MIIGIGGISRSGKSYLAEKLKELLEKGGSSVCILAQDDFVFPEKEIPKIRNHIDWEIPESIDWKRYEAAIINSVQTYNYVLVEGLMIFWDQNIWNQLDYKIWVSLSKDTFLQRKKDDLRWGKEPDWYITYIWESFQKYGQIPSGMQGDLVLDGEQNLDANKIFQNFPP